MAVIHESAKVVVVMPNGNINFKCVNDGCTAKVEPRGADPVPAGASNDRHYCMAVDGHAKELPDQVWAP